MARMDNMDMPPQRGPETADEIAAAIFMECLMNLVQSAAYLLGKVPAKDTADAMEYSAFGNRIFMELF